MILAILGTIVLSDAARTLTAPARWDKRAWALAGGTCAVGGGLFLLDEGIRTRVRGERYSSLADGLDHLGEGLWLSGGLLAASGAGALCGQKTLVDAGLVGVESWLIAGLVSQAGKYLLGRARPYAEKGAFSFHMFATEEAFHSLPSGHTTVAFAGLSGFAFRTQNPYVVAGCLVLASGVAWARVYQDVHWASDVFWGAALGLSVGYCVAQGRENPSSGLSLGPGRIIYTF